ncbi:hypothetical protein ACFX2B_041277 [Malus domestica]
MAAAAASSSSSDSHWKYDVFLNFRGLEAAASSSSAISTKLWIRKQSTPLSTLIDAEELQKATTFRSSWQLLATQAFDPSFFFRKLCFFDVVLERTCPDNGMRGCTQADSGSCFIRSRSIRLGFEKL